MKPLFSSLGSNYSFSDAITSISGLLQAHFSPMHLLKLQLEVKAFFDTEYLGETYFFYKGRDALEAALRGSEISHGDGVITQAFACYAVEEAILRSGAVPVYADIAQNSTNLSLETIKKAVKKSSVPIKAVIVQYSLGASLDTEEIAAWCTQQKIVLIEDIAQGYGGTTKAGGSVGTIGDITVFSFGRDKVIDAVTGGACCFRNISYKKNALFSQWYAGLHTQVGFGTLVGIHVYPLLTWVIRTTFTWGISFLTLGKSLVFIAKLVGLIRSPTYSATTSASLLPYSCMPLLAAQIARIKKESVHRKNIAEVYLSAFGHSAAISGEDEVVRGSLLRFPIIVKDPAKIAKKLRAQNIHISDRWYRAAVDCSTLSSCVSSYEEGSAVRAEHLAKHVLTLPTHRNIKKDDAERIVSAIKDAHS